MLKGLRVVAIRSLRALGYNTIMYMYCTYAIIYYVHYINNCSEGLVECVEAEGFRRL